MTDRWIGSFGSPVPIRCRGPLHLYTARHGSRDKPALVVMAPNLPVEEAREQLGELARLHRLVASEHVPDVLVADVEANPPWVALDCDAVGDVETLTDYIRQTGEKVDIVLATALGKTIIETLIRVHETRDPRTARPVCLGALAPSNIVFGPDGETWLVGFGAGPFSGASIAPEVAAGSGPTPSADVYALTLFLRSQAGFVRLPRVLRRVVAGDSFANTKMMMLYVWSNLQILAGPARSRPTMAEVLAHARSFWKVLGFVEPDVEGFAGLVARAMSVDGDRLEDGPPSTGAPCILMGPEAAWLETPNRMRHTLRARRPLRRLLLALANAHRDHPGRAVYVDELLDAGWPGESPLPEAGNNRVYVAISTLRKMGLADHLQRWDGGYRLDPNVRCRFE